MKVKKLIDSFNYAIEGIIYSVRTQRNMKIHMVIAILALLACFFCNVSRMELLVVILTITMVIAAEMINTAVESAVDATTNYYHPLVKIAKNVAAGAVLVTAINAVIVGYIIFYDKLMGISLKLLFMFKSTSPHKIFFIMIIMCIVTVIVKAVYGEGTPLRGGMPSGHSVLSFSLATIITLIADRPVIMVLSYGIALMVAQSRVDAEVHSVWEVFIGAAMGILLTMLLYSIMR